MNSVPGAHPTAHSLIEALRLTPLPGEGGFFRQTWRSETSSAILFLLTRSNFSALHQLDREEGWHFHAGEPIEHVQLDPDSGKVHLSRLGADVLAGETPQIRVPAGIWQGARLWPQTTPRFDFALVGCTVSPPWDDHAYTLGRRDPLVGRFPDQADLIRALTR